MAGCYSRKKPDTRDEGVGSDSDSSEDWEHGGRAKDGAKARTRGQWGKEEAESKLYSLISRFLLSDGGSKYQPLNFNDVPRFIVFGAPGLGKSILSRRLASVWNCEYVNASKIVLENIRYQTLVGELLRDKMTTGKDLDDRTVIKLIFEKLHSSECVTKGYVLDDFPNNSERALSIDEQFNMIENLVPKPNCFIYVTAPDREHRLLWENRRIDPATGELYQLFVTEEEKYLMEGIGAPAYEELPQELKTRLITRQEEVSQSLDGHISFHEKVLKPKLEEFLDDMKDTPTVRVTGGFGNAKLFQDTVLELYNCSNHPELAKLDLFGELTYSLSDNVSNVLDLPPETIERKSFSESILGYKV
ncbi:unnamed protein product [Calicophoron daubneyi]|uniref:Adenylate kinase n=1 Tax=Calicophoron daubneyi TaxID=300641 RepID=A0AAV2T8I4_CALDB